MANNDSNPWQEMSDPGFNETKPTQAEVDHRQGYDDQGNKKRSSWGCLLYGCLTVVLLGIVAMIIAGVAAYYFAKGQVEKYTDENPIAIETIEMSDEEIAAIEARLEAFSERIAVNEPSDQPKNQPSDDTLDKAGEELALEDEAAAAPAGPPSHELVLTAKEINALIAKEPNLKGHVFIRIEEGQISGDVSMPIDFLPMVGKGRYFNAAATFEVSLDPDKNRGMLDVRLIDAEVKGQPLPQQFIDAIAGENFAKEIYDEPEAAAILERFESLRIEGDRLILKIRPFTAEERAQIKEEIEADATPVPAS